MKLGLSLDGVKATEKALDEVGTAITSDFRNQVVNSGIQLRDRAKEILQGKVNPIYSTGRLADSIEMKMQGGEDVTITAWGFRSLTTGRWTKASAITGITVGPNGSAVNEGGQSYAEWVEFGHYMVSGWAAKGNIEGKRWWEGHHYMEGAWSEISPTITKEIADNLKLRLTYFGRSRATKRVVHLRTGEFVSKSWRVS